MAITPAKSSQYTMQDGTHATILRAPSSDVGSKLRASYGKLTFTAAGTGTAKMLRLPPGKVRVHTDLCRVVCPVGTATADLHVGYAAYTGGDGVAVVADDNAFADNVDVGGGAIDAAFSLPAGGFLEFDSLDGVDIEVMIDTANSPAAGDLVVSVVYQMGN